MGPQGRHDRIEPDGHSRQRGPGGQLGLVLPDRGTEGRSEGREGEKGDRRGRDTPADGHRPHDHARRGDRRHHGQGRNRSGDAPLLGLVRRRRRGGNRSRDPQIRQRSGGRRAGKRIHGPRPGLRAELFGPLGEHRERPAVPGRHLRRNDSRRADLLVRGRMRQACKPIPSATKAIWTPDSVR